MVRWRSSRRRTKTRGLHNLHSMKQPQYLRVTSVLLLLCAFFLQGCTKDEPIQFEFIETYVNGVQCYSLQACSKDADVAEIVIPESWNGLPVLRIEKHAFHGAATTHSVDIGAVEIISPQAFVFCSQLREVNLRNARIIGAGAFMNCHYIESIVIPKTVEEIEGEAFADCTNLESIYFEGDPILSGRRIFPSYSTIYGIPGGNVAAYAQQYGISFVSWTPTPN